MTKAEVAALVLYSKSVQEGSRMSTDTSRIVDWVVLRDGKELYRGLNPDCFGWLLRHQGNSVHHATTYEGYKIKAVKAI